MFLQVVALASVMTLASAQYGGFGLGGLGGFGKLGGGGGGSGGLGGLGGYGGGEGGYGGHKETFIDFRAPPKYEYKYAVADHHTGDQKEKAEVRHGDLTKTEYEWGEKDRKVQVSKVIHGAAPVKIIGHH